MEEDIRWTPDLLTGKSVIDTQHRLLFQLAEDMVTNLESTDFEAVIEEMHRYADNHFADEEKLMASVNYPAILDHRTKHREFRKHMDECCENLDPTVLSSILRAKNTILSWWRDHILADDLVFVEYYKNHSKKEI